MSKSIAASHVHDLLTDTSVIVLLNSTMKNDSAQLVNPVKSEKIQGKKKKVKKWYVLAGFGVETSNVKFFSFKNFIFVPRSGIGVEFQLYKN